MLECPAQNWLFLGSLDFRRVVEPSIDDLVGLRIDAKVFVAEWINGPHGVRHTDIDRLKRELPCRNRDDAGIILADDAFFSILLKFVCLLEPDPLAV
jgi:hypothetical protein